MQAYRDALADNNTSFVLSPDSEFFRFFNSPTLAPVEQAHNPAAGHAVAADRAPLQPATDDAALTPPADGAATSKRPPATASSVQ
jgi:membrane protease subunit HflC